jgi:hypothetical protein
MNAPLSKNVEEVERSALAYDNTVFLGVTGIKPMALDRSV